MTDQTFNRIGVTTRNGITRVRFTNNPEREIILIKDGFDDITFLDLPGPMTKPEAVTYLLARKEDFEDQKDRIAIDEANDRYNTVVVKGTRASVKAPSMDDLKARAADAVEA
jgi:hypothetical protein